MNALQNSANERSTSKSEQYQNLKWRFRVSKLEHLLTAATAAASALFVWSTPLRIRSLIEDD